MTEQPEQPRFDVRSLTDDQRHLAADIASSMGLGHEEGCAVWWEDPDGCSCPLLAEVANALHAARVVEVVQELGYDSSTGRGDRLKRQPFDPHPAQAAAPEQDRWSPDEEHCHKCGRPVGVVWTAPDELWQAVMGTPGGIRCIRCFDEEAEAQGRFIRWVPREESREGAAVPEQDEAVRHSEAMAGECPGGCSCRLYSPDADPADCGCDSYCTMDTTDWPKWSALATPPPVPAALDVDDDLKIRWGVCGNCDHSPGNHGGTLLRTPGKPCYVKDCRCPGYAARLTTPEASLEPLTMEELQQDGAQE